MGQQQFLLITFVLILVGIATTLAFSFVKSEERQLKLSEYQGVVLETVGYVQAYWHKPMQMGGGNRTFEGLNFDKIPCALGIVLYEQLDNPISCINESNSARINIFSSTDSVVLTVYFDMLNESLKADYVIYPSGMSIKNNWAPI